MQSLSPSKQACQNCMRSRRGSELRAMRQARERGFQMTRLMAFCRRFAVLLVLGSCTPLAALAQETTTGSLAGEVVDSQDLAVPGATITLGSEQGTRTYVSNSEGRFLVPYLTPGLFTVRVEMQGFVPVEQRDIKVRLGQRLELRFVMQPGAMTEEVTVLA